ncbi:MAG: hypothetical protein Q8R00_01895 [Candidatus Nanoarchaeia archaeon]|nr:hypothetical protein [Candidatus Nanoarchaeia archaeon]
MEDEYDIYEEETLTALEDDDDINATDSAIMRGVREAEKTEEEEEEES